MTPQTGPTIQEIVTQVTLLVAQVGTITTIVSLGMTQFIKEFTKNSRIIAIFAIVFGFLAGLTTMKLFNGSFSSPLSLLVGGISALGAPGVFSVVKAIKGSSKIVAPEPEPSV